MKSSFDSDETEAVLVFDANNAFNSLNRDVALHNLRHVCPSIATVLINAYWNATELFVDGSTLFLEEDTTQGAALAILMYAFTTVPLFYSLHNHEDMNQVWYADDTTALGGLVSLCEWWDKHVNWISIVIMVMLQKHS